MSKSEKQVVHASGEGSVTNLAEVTANSASTRAGVVDSPAAATAAAAVTSSVNQPEKSVKPKKKRPKYTYRGAVTMSKIVSSLFCKVTNKPLPKSGVKKIHVDGALKRLHWNVQKFMNIYLDFRETYAGQDTELVQFYLEYKLNGGMWDKVACLKKMAVLANLHRQQQNRHLKGRIKAISKSATAEFSDSSASNASDDDDFEPPKKRSKKRTKKVRRKIVRTKKAKRRDRKWRLTEESVTDSDPAVYSRKDSGIVLRSMEDIVAGVYRGHMTDFKCKWFLTMMQRKSLGELTECILPEDMEKLLPLGSRPPVSVTCMRCYCDVCDTFARH